MRENPRDASSQGTNPGPGSHLFLYSFAAVDQRWDPTRNEHLTYQFILT